jgi:hypothetical protein
MAAVLYLLQAALQRGAVLHEQPAAPRAAVPPAASCTRHCLRPSARPPPPCDCPRRCALSAALAQQPRRSARAGPEHTRCPLLHASHARLLASSAPTPRLPPPAAPPLSARPSPPAAGYLNDLYRFSPAANNWTLLSPSGSGPSPRSSMGFAATPDGMLYVFGGSYDGIEGRGWGQMRWMGPVAWNAVMRRARTAPLLLLSLGEGTRVTREEICRHVCTYAAARWAVYVQLRKELAMRWFALGGEIERAGAGHGHDDIYM